MEDLFPLRVTGGGFDRYACINDYKRLRRAATNATSDCRDVCCEEATLVVWHTYRSLCHPPTLLHTATPTLEAHVSSVLWVLAQ